nr:IS5 family transposase [Pseudomonas cichorii]
MAKRYELSDASWELIKALVFPEQKMGRPRSDDRLVLHGILWILCSGAAWRDLPERFGPWSTVYQRFRDWRDDATFDRILERLHIRLNREGLIDLDTWMIDSGGTCNPSLFRRREKGGAEEPIDHALGRSRGGLTTKIHMLCDANGVPLHFILSPGQASDIAHAQPLLDQVRILGKPGRPRKRSRWLLADKGYDAEHLRQYFDRYRMQPVIPLRAMPRKLRPGCPDSLIVQSIGSGISLSGCLAG